MAYGAWDHNKLQFGRETVAGTAVAATEIWRGVFSNIMDDRERVIVEENIGVLVTAERTYTSRFGATIATPATPLTFEQFPHILEAGVQTATPSGVDPAFVRTYAFPVNNSVNTIKTYTWESVNVIVTGDYREAQYCYVEEFEISGQAGEAVEMSATWRGRAVNTGAATALTTLIPVEEVLMNKCKLYLDPSGDTLGTTQKTGVFMGFNMRVRTGVVPVPVGDGSLFFAAHQFVKPEITFSLTLVLENGANVVSTERAAYEAEDVRLIRVEMTGSDANHLINLDFAAKWDSIDDYENTDGNTTVTLNGHAVYSQTDTLFWQCEVTNGRATL
jgi:hypothetical protein